MNKNKNTEIKKKKKEIKKKDIEKKNTEIKTNNTEIKKKDIEKKNTEIKTNNTEIKKKDIEKKNTEIKTNNIEINKINEINNKKIKELELYIEKNKKKEYNNFLRYKAEIENIKRRTSISIEKTYKFALENFIKDLLPTIDNLERSINILDKNNIKLSLYIEGIELTLKTIINLINKYGIKIINKTKIKFNPIYHQSIGLIKSNNLKSNYIIDVIQNGYILYDRLLRPALVIVSK